MNSTIEGLDELTKTLAVGEMPEAQYLHNGYGVAKKKRGGMLGHFQVEECLGTGGMGEVYRCSNSFLGETFAVKILDFSNNEKKVLERFIREAKLMAMLNNPHIATFYDAFCDQEGKEAYLVIEYIDGQSVADILKTGPMQETEVIRIMQEVCRGLSEAHKKGIVHRDIKPANIMIAKDGTVKLIDLGIAKIIDDISSVDLTMEMTMIGSPHYASPEQCRSSKSVDIRSDLFSLGATMYHMLTGKKPFDGELPQDIISKVLREEPIPLVVQKHDISPILVKIIKEMMRKDPSKRTQNVDILHEQLEAARICENLHFYHFKSVLFRPFRLFFAYFMHCPSILKIGIMLLMTLLSLLIAALCYGVHHYLK